MIVLKWSDCFNYWKLKVVDSDYAILSKIAPLSLELNQRSVLLSQDIY